MVPLLKVGCSAGPENLPEFSEENWRAGLPLIYWGGVDFVEIDPNAVKMAVHLISLLANGLQLGLLASVHIIKRYRSYLEKRGQGKPRKSLARSVQSIPPSKKRVR